MEPNEALLLSIESILDDDELDNAGRNTALIDTVRQYVAFTGAPHAKAVIIKRDDVEAEGEAGFASGTPSVGDSQRRLRLAYEDKRRSYPNLGDAHNLGLAWRSLGRGDRQALLEDSDAGEDPTFEHVGKLADILLESVAIGKIQPGLTREQAMAAAIDERPEIFKIAREAKRADLNKGNTDGTAAVARRMFALQLLTAKATEILKAEPALTIEAARVEARRRWPDVAARERA
jgi:hypothetical protein